MRRTTAFLLTAAISLAVFGCSGSSGSSTAVGTDSAMTLNSVYYGRLVKVNGVDTLMAPDSEVDVDPETGELLSVIDQGTQIRSLDSNVIGNVYVPRNAALLLRFSDVVDPQTANLNTIQVRQGEAPSQLVRGRYIIKGTDVIFDPAIEAWDQDTNPELSLNPQGLPKSFVADVSNLQVFIPTTANAVLRNTKGRAVGPRRLDVEAGQVDIKLFFRSGGDFDVARGYLPDSVDPHVLTKTGEEYIGNLFPNPFDIADVVFFDFPPNDDQSPAPTEDLTATGNGSAAVPVVSQLLNLTPIVPGSLIINEEGNSPNRLTDQPIDTNGDDIPEYGLINGTASLSAEDTGVTSVNGTDQVPFSSVPLDVFPIQPGSLTIYNEDDPTNSVTDDGAGSIGGASVDYDSGIIDGTVTFPFGFDIDSSRLLANYQTSVGAEIDYVTGELSGVLRFPQIVSNGATLKVNYRYEVSTKNVVEQVPNFSAIHLRFSEPMNPESFGPFSTMFVVKDTSGSPRFPGDAYFGRVEHNSALTEFIFRPPLQPQGWGSEGNAYSLFLRTDNPNTPQVEGITDLAGRGIRTGNASDVFDADPSNFQSLEFSFTVQRDVEAVEGGILLQTFDDLGPYDNAGNTHNRASPPSIIAGGPVSSWEWDLENVSPTDGGPTVVPNFPPGVQTPFNPQGARIQHAVPRTILGGGTSNTIWTLTGLSWAPIGNVVFADTWTDFSIDVGHTHVVPNTRTNSGGFLQDSRSGLKQFWAQNYLADDPVTPTTVVDRGTRYQIRPPSNLPNPFRVAFPSFDRTFPYNSTDTLLLDMGAAATAAGGFNGYQIFVSVQGWSDPDIRIFSAGTEGFVISDPWALEKAGGVGGSSNAFGDNSVYIHTFFFKSTQTSSESPWFEMFQGKPQGFDIDWSAPVFEPDLANLPTGTQILVEYRGADDDNGTNATQWSKDFNVLDNRVAAKFRLTFLANPDTEQVPGIDSLAIPFSLIPIGN
ncbi:MAG: hypothetical protein RL885_07915 [Planctomycetota bacterium]